MRVLGRLIRPRSRPQSRLIGVASRLQLLPDMRRPAVGHGTSGGIVYSAYSLSGCGQIEDGRHRQTPRTLTRDLGRERSPDVG